MKIMGKDFKATNTLPGVVFVNGILGHTPVTIFADRVRIGDSDITGRMKLVGASIFENLGDRLIAIGKISRNEAEKLFI